MQAAAKHRSHVDTGHIDSVRKLWNRIANSSLSKMTGQVAQLVEQRTENPCVGGSSPSLATLATFLPNLVQALAGVSSVHAQKIQQ